MKYAITIVTPPGYIHAAVFNEIAETLHYGLLSLGHDALITTEGNLPGHQHIVLGANLLPAYPLPLAKDAILYNLEQIYLGSEWIRPELIEIFRRYRVWDYNKKNAAALGSLGVKVEQILPIGYTKELTRIAHAPDKDIDVLFYGSMNPRREQIINKMHAAGLRVAKAFGIYGRERDNLIGRSKLVLNIHYYESKILEMARISYLLANHCTVLSEHSADPGEDALYAKGVAFAHYHQLVQRARELIGSPTERKRLARQGFKLISACDIKNHLHKALNVTTPPI